MLGVGHEDSTGLDNSIKKLNSEKKGSGCQLEKVGEGCERTENPGIFHQWAGGYRHQGRANA